MCSAMQILFRNTTSCSYYANYQKSSMNRSATRKGREDWRGRERLCVFSSSSHPRLSVHFPQWGISLPSTAIANSVRISLWYK